MSIFTRFENWLTGVELKSDPVNVLDIPTHSAEDIRASIAGDCNATGLLQISTVMACARVIAEGLAQVPCLLQRRAKSGGIEDAVEHPLYALLSRSPNAWMTSFEFREWIALRAVISGNAYVYVSRGTDGKVLELIPLEPAAVTITQGKALGEVLYTIKGVGSVTHERIWHIKGPSWSGLKGLNLNEVAQRALNLASYLEAFGENLFKNGSRPSGVLSTDRELNLEQAQTLRAQWEAASAGLNNAHKTAILSHGTSFQQMQTNANDAQFVEARRFQIEELCRVMRVDPLMIGQSVNSASYASVEQRFLAHMTHTLRPWFTRFEQSAEQSLLSAAELQGGYRVFLDDRSMTRGSAIDRANYASIMKQNGVLTTNEIRALDGFERSNDPDADKLTPAVNLFGPTAPVLSQTAK